MGSQLAINEVPTIGSPRGPGATALAGAPAMVGPPAGAGRLAPASSGPPLVRDASSAPSPLSVGSVPGAAMNSTPNSKAVPMIREHRPNQRPRPGRGAVARRRPPRLGQLPYYLVNVR